MLGRSASANTGIFAASGSAFAASQAVAIGRGVVGVVDSPDRPWQGGTEELSAWTGSVVCAHARAANAV
jgi:hypothetical protein